MYVCMYVCMYCRLIHILCVYTVCDEGTEYAYSYILYSMYVVCMYRSHIHATADPRNQVHQARLDGLTGEVDLSSNIYTAHK